MFILTITVKGEPVRVQLNHEKSAQGFSWWLLQQGYTVRCRLGETVTLSDYENAIGGRLLNQYSASKGST